MTTYTSYNQLPLMLNAEQVAGVLGISRAGAYQLFHQDGFPCVRLGKRMMVEREKLFAWIDAQTQWSNERTAIE